MQICRATASDSEAISRLIQSLAFRFTLDPQGLGAEAFLKRVEPAAIQAYIAASNFNYFVGFAGPELMGELMGVVAVRDNTHLYHLFVAGGFQGRGFSGQLWRHGRQAAMLAGNLKGFTVNSSPFAVPVYERFGFRATGPKVETSGIAFVPMKLELADSDQTGDFPLQDGHSQLWNQ
jgi:GNAT superfamily N-acetyltransferase